MNEVRSIQDWTSKSRPVYATRNKVVTSSTALEIILQLYAKNLQVREALHFQMHSTSYLSYTEFLVHIARGHNTGVTAFDN